MALRDEMDELLSRFLGSGDDGWFSGRSAPLLDMWETDTAIELAIAKSRKTGAMTLPSVALAVADGRLHAAVPEVADVRAASEVWLLGLTKTTTIAIAALPRPGPSEAATAIASRIGGKESVMSTSRMIAAPIRPPL